MKIECYVNLKKKKTNFQASQFTNWYFVHIFVKTFKNGQEKLENLRTSTYIWKDGKLILKQNQIKQLPQIPFQGCAVFRFTCFLQCWHINPPKSAEEFPLITARKGWGLGYGRAAKKTVTFPSLKIFFWELPLSLRRKEWNMESSSWRYHCLLMTRRS